MPGTLFRYMSAYAAGLWNHRRSLRPVCLRSWTQVNFAGVSAVNACDGSWCRWRVFLYVGTTSQALPAAISIQFRFLRVFSSDDSHFRRFLEDVRTLSNTSEDVPMTSNTSEAIWIFSDLITRLFEALRPKRIEPERQPEIGLRSQSSLNSYLPALLITWQLYVVDYSSRCHVVVLLSLERTIRNWIVRQPPGGAGSEQLSISPLARSEHTFVDFLLV